MKAESLFQKSDIRKQLPLWICMAAVGFVYFFLLGERGYFLTPDSQSYINAVYEREPFYPLVIMLSRAVVGERNSLYMVVFLQEITAFLVSLYTIFKLREQLSLNRLETLAAYGLLLLPFGLDTMWSAPRVNYTHMIMTDCFSYALFYLFIVAMLDFYKTGKTGAYVRMLLLVSLMMLNRNQMEILFVNMAILSVAQCLIRARKPNWKKCIMQLAGIGIAVVVTVFLTLSYCYVQWGKFSKSSENNFTLMTNLLYASDEEDVELFEDEEAAKVFAELYARIDAAGWNYRYAPSGILGNGNYLLECHDPVKSSIIRPYFEEYVSALGMGPKSFEGDQVKKAVTGRVIQVLLKEHFGDLIYHALCSMPRGFTYSVIPIIYPGTFLFALAGAVIVWAVFFGAWIYLMIRKRGGIISMLAFQTGAFMVMNVVALCVIIYVAYRYINYTQGLFWLVFYLMFREIFRLRKERRHLSLD